MVFCTKALPAAILASFCLLNSLIAIAQQQNPQSAIFDQLVQYYSNQSQEKIHVQTDKSFYRAGDDIWFSIYITDANTNKLNALNSKVYLQLKNDRDSVIRELILNPLLYALTGNLPVPDSLPSGYYILNVFTRKSLAQTSNQVYEKPLYILNSFEKIIASPLFIMNADTGSAEALQITFTDFNNTPVVLAPIQYTVLTAGTVKPKQLALTTDINGKIKIQLTGKSAVSVNVQYNNFNRTFHLPKADNKLDLQFLPEGGNIINGINSTVAFKAIDKSGRGIAVEGYIKDDRDDSICNFKSVHAGMGKFSFFPKRGHVYTAYVKQKNNTTLKYTLPDINPNAYRLELLRREQSGLVFRISLGDSLYERKKKTNLLGITKDKLLFSAEGTDMYDVYVPTKDFPEGIARFTLFDEKNNAVSERLVFIRRNISSIDVKQDKENYPAREKINLLFTSFDSVSKVLPAAFSVSVTDIAAHPQAKEEENILTNLLLQSDLNGTIENPAYYFDDKNPGVSEALDLVMMIHGWKRFSWDNVKVNINAAPADNIDKDLGVSGIARKADGSAAKKYVITLFSNRSGLLFKTDTTDNEGRFSFQHIDFMDSTQFVLQAVNPSGANEEVKISINNDRLPVNSNGALSVNYDSEDIITQKLVGNKNVFAYDSAIAFRNAKILQEVILRNTKRSRPLNYDESKRFSSFSYVITPDVVKRHGNFNLKNVLLTVPGVALRNGYINLGGMSGMQNGVKSEPIVILDGVQMPADTAAVPGITIGGVESILMNIDVNSVDFIEVLKGADAAIFGMQGGNGAIVINTKQSTVQYRGEDRKGIYTIYPKGYYRKPKEFYVPAYDIAAVKKNPAPDLRTTIYWNGRVITDSTGKATLSFFSADSPSDYLVTIEGLTQNGNVLYKSFIIKRSR